MYTYIDDYIFQIHICIHICTYVFVCVHMYHIYIRILKLYTCTCILLTASSRLLSTWRDFAPQLLGHGQVAKVHIRSGLPKDATPILGAGSKLGGLTHKPTYTPYNCILRSA